MADLKLHELQKQNLLNGGKMVLLPINIPKIAKDVGYTWEDCYDVRIEYSYTRMYFTDDSYSIDRPVEVEDEFEIEKSEYIIPRDLNKIDANIETFKYNFKVKSIKCVRVQDLKSNEIINLGIFFDKLAKKQTVFEYLVIHIDSMFGKGTYEQNPYMFLIEVE